MRLFSPFSRRGQAPIADTSRNNDLQPTGSRITQAISVVAAAGLVFASCGFGALFAWHTGLHHGTAMAALFVLFAVSLELCKPLAVSAMFSAFRSWGIFRGVALGLLATVAVVYSLTAELTLMSMARADLVAERQAGAKTAKRADNQRDRIETELSKLANVRPAATVKAEIAGILADQRLANCRAMFDPRTRAACPRVARLKAELGNAERREKLEADLAALQTTAPVAAVDRPADPGAHAVGVFLAALGLPTPTGLSEWMAIVGVISLEVGSALAGLLVASVGGQRGGHQTPSQTSTTVELNVSGRTTTQPAPSQAASPDTKPAGKPDGDGSKPRGKRPKKPAKKRTPAGKRKLGNVVRLVQREGGQLHGGQRELARRLKVSKSRANELLHEAAAAGLVKVQTSKLGTSVALAR